MIKWKNQHPVLISALFLALLAGCESDNEIIPDPQPIAGAVIDAEVGGAEQPNQVFIDFSTGTQTAVNRGKWDLAFYNGPEFRVKLNSSVGMLAMTTDSNSLVDITEEDSAGLGSQLDLNAIFAALMGPPPSWLDEASTWLDASSGDLTGTAIVAISATEDENLVYFLNRGKNPDETHRGWRKIKIIRDGDGYQLQHAEIGSAEFTVINISKNNNYNFTYVSFDEGIVDVEPEKAKWDIAFSTYTNTIPISATTFIPYFYKDYVINNTYNVQVAEVSINEDLNYEDFTLADVADLEFDSKINTIGSAWRKVAQPGSGHETDVNRDRFYVVSDTDENYYKLRFTRLIHPQTGERGFPQIEYKLLTNE